MLDQKASRVAHAVRDILLIYLSWLFVPWTSALVSFYFVFHRKPSVRAKNPEHARRVLVTGVSMTKGLALARLFHLRGHIVIGADFEPDLAISPARFSKAIAKFFRLPKLESDMHGEDYALHLFHLVDSQKIDLWVSCSGVASAIEDALAKELIEKNSSCHCIQFGLVDTNALHEKDKFMDYGQQAGLPVPRTQYVLSHDEADSFLRSVDNNDKYILKSVNLDDSSRSNLTLLPFSSPKATSDYIRNLTISGENPWILQQFIRGHEYCTHSFVMKGEVKTFVACQSSDMLMHYTALPPSSALTKAMLEFTKEVAKDRQSDVNDFTGHLSFDFIVMNAEQKDPNLVQLYAIECNPRVHTAVALFSETPEMVDAYFEPSAGAEQPNGKAALAAIRPRNPHWIFWTAHDIVALLVSPTIQFLTLSGSLRDSFEGLFEILDHLQTWKDGSFERWDPLPFWWLYHVYWPVRLLSCAVRGQKWTRINVSTGKIFTC